MYGLGEVKPDVIIDKIVAVGVRGDKIVVDFKNNGELEFDDQNNQNYLNLLINAKQLAAEVRIEFWREIHPFSSAVIGGSIVSLSIT